MYSNWTLSSFLLALISLQFICGSSLSGQEYTPFEKNVGQWEESFHHKIKLRWGQIYFFNDRMVVDTWDQNQYANILACLHHTDECNGPVELLNKYAYEIAWVNTSSAKQWKSSEESSHYTNYFLGNNPDRWKSNIKRYAKLSANQLWDGIDLVYYEKDGFLKYDLMLQAYADPALIKFQLNHTKGQYIKNGNLFIKTTVGEVQEMKPYAYQIINGNKVEVKCNYVLNKNIVSYKLYSDYNPSLPLVIDPQIIFSTFSGSAGDNWGTTATYDNLGNAYGGGILFNQTYPTTFGAYQTNLAGNCDVAITKYNPTGTAMLFSTLLGGQLGEIPYSMVVDDNNNLVVMGTTGSANFPTTAGSFDNTFNGGPSFGMWQAGINGGFYASYTSGSDFFVSKFSANGTQLLASTFVGGSNNDGFNTAGGLNFNYGDNLRGEVLTDSNNDIYVISTTRSTDFPTVNAFQNAHGGGSQDAVVFKLNTNLSSMLWSSYYGGAGEDAGYGLQIAANGSVYFCGGTNSSTISGMNGILTQNQGGVDGFVVRCPATGGSIQHATFIGTSDYDQCYFVQLDSQGDVFLFGQTEGNYPISPPTGQTIYSHANGSLFFHKLNATLNQSSWSTRFGTNTVFNKLVPGAFLVDNCNFISFSLWAGTSNSSSSLGLPVTADAYQSTSDGNDFYLGILNHDAVSLHYGSYFGGPMSGEHVDGGTSRFDKNGIIYQAVCGGCGGLNDMPTTPGAWSASNNSSNCNMAVFKFDLSEYSTIIGVPAQDFICDGSTVAFTNLSTGTNNYIWHFGDGNTSTANNPTHTYANPGTYEVLLISDGNSACAFNDTARIIINVETEPTIQFSDFPPICSGDSIQLNVSGGVTYQWQSAPGISVTQLNSDAPWVHPLQTTVYSVNTSNPCGSASGSIEVQVIQFNVQILNNQNTICLGDTLSLSATDAQSYLWEPTDIILINSGQNITFLPIENVTVYLTALNQENCKASDSLDIFLLLEPNAVAPNDTIICYGQSISLNSQSSFNTIWTNLSNNQAYIQNSIVVSPDTLTYFEMFVSNQCGAITDTVAIDVSRIYPVVGPDIEVCYETPVQVFASGGTYYQWIPASDFTNAVAENTTLIPRFDTKYYVIISNEIGCSVEEELPVRTYPQALIDAGPDLLIPFGGTAQLQGITSPGNYFWSPATALSCTHCLNPTARLFDPMEYTLTLIDTFGCKYKDMMKVKIEGAIYVPNAFTPNGDGINDTFSAIGLDVEKFRLEIFTRNGELVYASNDINKGWDGTVNGNEAQMDVYVYVIHYMLNDGYPRKQIGRVTLVM